MDIWLCKGSLLWRVFEFLEIKFNDNHIDDFQMLDLQYAFVSSKYSQLECG